MNHPAGNRLCLAALLACLAAGCTTGHPWSTTRSLFNGRTFAGWDGDTAKTWRIEQGEIVAGNVAEKVPRNEFLATTANYTNFVLRLKFRLTGTEGFVNSGVQFRSQRVPNDAEMKGYQADIGEGWYGTIYDESRRNKPLIKPAESAVKQAVKVGQWNDYEIRATGPRMVLSINGIQLVDYTETDPSIPQFGRIGLQIHGDGKTEVRFKDIRIQVLP